MKRKLIALALASYAVFVSLVIASDSAGVHLEITDTGTNKNAHLKLHDNLDGTKSLVVFAVIVTPSPTSTNTPTPTPTNTPTPTPTP